MDLLTSAEAAEYLGVGATAIKRWADAGTLPCVRTAGGHRRFERAVVIDFGRGRNERDASSDSSWLKLLLSAPDPHLVVARLFEERAARGAWHLVAHRVGDVLRELGDAWATRRISVAEEHLASSRLQLSLSLVSTMLPMDAGARSCLLATAEGDDHTLGLTLVELCLREAGWRSEWLGRATRGRDIIERVAGGRVQMVALSASLASSSRVRLARFAHAIAAACADARIPLALGGDGAWPNTIEGGHRFRDLLTFYHSLSTSRTSAQEAS